jgi:nucleotide-binding universal stress UspA family protein
MSRIVVGVDGSEGSQGALEWAAQEAQYRNAELHIVSAWLYPISMGYTVPVDAEPFEKSAQEIGEQAAAYVHKTWPEVQVRVEVREAQPALTLVEASTGADMLEVGTRGLGGFRGLLLGSVSQHCAHHARCPIVIVRPVETAHD